MDFATLFKKVSPILRKIAKSYNGHGFFIDGDDLYQEMCIHLWENFKDGVPQDINIAYIIRGCEFYLLNYLRKKKEKMKILSLDKPINENENTLKDILEHRNENINENIDRKMAVDYIRNNGFSKREKKVFSLLLKGYTVREVGIELGISHVMVIKHKQKIISKCKENWTLVS
jgi:RNA polymerase sigma factor (sigma-70 family)